ncbi:hypothetical protein [Mesorhizobium sp. M1273]|uniref:hypothetical protein n=1 Tax=Mesorhizobium sp. M1273 TaxID=2957075 RepID=UPI00333CFEC7
MTQFAVFALLIGTGCVSAVGAIIVESESTAVFRLVLALFAFYVFCECRVYISRSDDLGLLSPVLLASFCHFFLGYILPSVATIYDPWILDRFSLLASTDDQTKALLISMLATFCMWRGYYLGRLLIGPIRHQLRLTVSLRKGLRPALIPVIMLQALYVVLVLIAASRGIFGFAGSGEARQANVDFLEILNIGMSGGALSLFLLLTHCFRVRAEGQSAVTLSVLCASLLFVSVAFGAISGFKSQIVMPFVLLTMARFVATRQISLVYISLGFVAMILAYNVIEPYRVYLNNNSVVGTRDVGTLFEALQQSKEDQPLDENDIPLGSQIISRFDLTGMTSVGLAHATYIGVDPEISSRMGESIYLSPILAFVPRFLWSGKQSYSTGVWFNQAIIGKLDDATTSVGMGPVTFLYFVGGVAGVAAGFALLGILQALIFEGLARSGAGGLIIYLSATTMLVMIPSDFGPALTGTLRIIPIAFVAQYLLLAADRPSGRFPR